MPAPEPPAVPRGASPPDPSSAVRELTEDEGRRADLVWAGAVALGFLLVFLVLNVARSAGVPVLVSFAVAYALDPVIDRLETRGLSRTIAILLLFLLAAVVLTASMLYLVPAIGQELAKLPDFLRDIAQKAVPRIESAIGMPLPSDVRETAAALSRRGGGFAEKVLPGVASFALSAAGGTASALGAAIGLLLIPVLIFYVLRDFDLFVAEVRSLLPRRHEALVASRFAQIDSVLSAFIRGQLTVGAILTCIYALGLSVAGLDLAVVIGAIAGFGTLVPYLGPAVGLALALLSLAVSWDGVWQLFAVAGTFAFGMTLEGLFITPRIVGQKVGLSPLGVMVAILVFAELFGFAGVLLAVPTTAAMKVVFHVLVQRYRTSAAYRGAP